MTAPTIDAAWERLMTRPAIDLADTASVMCVSPGVIQRSVARGDFAFPYCRIGQRWVFPTKPLREFLHAETEPQVPTE